MAFFWRVFPHLSAAGRGILAGVTDFQYICRKDKHKATMSLKCGIVGLPGRRGIRREEPGPTGEDVSELFEKCKVISANYNGADEYVVAGDNGNKIFIPASGYMEDSMQQKPDRAYLWSKTLRENYSYCAKTAYFDMPLWTDVSGNQRDPDCGVGWWSRFVGFCIRPVME